MSKITCFALLTQKGIFSFLFLFSKVYLSSHVQFPMVLFYVALLFCFFNYYYFFPRQTGRGKKVCLSLLLSLNGNPRFALFFTLHPETPLVCT